MVLLLSGYIKPVSLPRPLVAKTVIIVVELDKVPIPHLFCQVTTGVPRPQDGPPVGEVVELVGITSYLILGEYQHIVAIDSLVLLAVLVLVINHDKDLPGIPMPLKRPEGMHFVRSPVGQDKSTEVLTHSDNPR